MSPAATKFFHRRFEVERPRGRTTSEQPHVPIDCLETHAKGGGDVPLEHAPLVQRGHALGRVPPSVGLELNSVGLLLFRGVGGRQGRLRLGDQRRCGLHDPAVKAVWNTICNWPVHSSTRSAISGRRSLTISPSLAVRFAVLSARRAAGSRKYSAIVSGSSV